MLKHYTAKEMRLLAETIDHGGAFVLTEPSLLEANVAMLRQSADMMEREEKRVKKYEYAEKYSDGEISPFHDEERIDSKYTLEASVVVRRSVGEWEEVE